MALEKNTVFSTPDGSMFRVLWAHGGEQMVWVIDVDDSRAWPELRSRSDLIDDFVNREIHLVDDPILNVLPSDDELSEAERRVRDSAWSQISSLVKKEPTIFSPKGRAQLVKDAIQKQGGTRQTYYKNLRRFFQRGGVSNALIPQYGNCGCRGKSKAISEQKRGRPRSISPGSGINVDEKILRHIRVAVSRKFLSSRKSYLRTAYDWMLGNCFPDEVKLSRTESGRNCVEIVKPDQVPTFEQFCYHYHQENNLPATLIRRHGARLFDKKLRPLLNSSQNEVSGPGSRYQIDATIIDIYAVSRFDRNRIVGRPTLYLVVDVFSRMIVGCYVGLEAPSWMCAAMALLNAVEDKVSFCGRYGIEIEPEEWPVSEMPLKLLGDRGEMESKIADRLVSAFGVELENAAPYRGDAKGVVERSFRTVHATLGPYVPGFVEPDFQVRGSQDYRLDAKLTVEEIAGIVIRSILIMNATPRKGYQTLPEVVSDNIPYAPIELWKWGKENLRADARPFKYEYSLLNLLPDKNVTVTRRGVQFKWGMYYMSPKLMAEPWYLEAQSKKEKLVACYHPGDMSRIYIRSPFERTLSYVAELAPHCKSFNGKSLVEIEALRKREREIKAEYTMDLSELTIGWQKDMEEIVANAIASFDEDYDPSLSKAERLRNIKANKAKELKSLIYDQIENLGLVDTSSDIKTITQQQEPDEDAESENQFIAQMRRRKHSE